MNKNELIKTVALRTNLTYAQVKEALTSITDSIKEAVKKEGKVTLPGFGVFSNTIRKSRTGRNPQTGASLEIPEKEVVKFKPYF